jgi:hypothetical protein
MSYGDQFTVAQLVWAAGLDLDEIYSDPTAGGKNASVRYEGQTVRIHVVFTGDHTKWDQRAHYEYFVSVNDMEAKVTWTDGGDVMGSGANATRITYDLHGLQLLYSQEAVLNVFDSSQLFLSILSGAGLLYVARLAADSFLYYLAPMRNDYRLYAEQVIGSDCH